MIKNPNHLMIDFETLDTKPNAVVLSLGLVLFDKHQMLATSYYEFDIASQMADGRTLSGDTIMWWLNQKTGRSFNPHKNEHYMKTMSQVVHWINSMTATYGKFDNVWANDPDFDCAILESLIPMNVPYQFWQKRSMRTFVEYVGKGEKIPRDKTQHHNALVDAMDQAKYIMARLP